VEKVELKCECMRSLSHYANVLCFCQTCDVNLSYVYNDFVNIDNPNVLYSIVAELVVITSRDQLVMLSLGK
jgi:hypothetical protein